MTIVRKTLVVAALSVLAACESSTEPTPQQPVLPASIFACETNTATLCATWTLSGSHYVADWSQGSHAVITAARFDSDLVVFVRDDPSGTSAGMHAIYQGIPTANNRVTNGIVTWTQDGHSFSGRWEAAW